MRTFTNTQTGETITEAEYVKRYGKPDFSTAKQIEPESSGYVSNVKKQIGSNIGEIVQSQKNSMQGTQNPFSAGANIAKNVTGAIVAPLAEAPILKQIGEGFGKVGQAIVDTKAGNKVTDFLAEKIPQTGLQTASDLIETGLNVSTIEGGVKSTKKGFSSSKNAVKNTVSSAKETISNVKNKVGYQQKQPIEIAVEDVVPNYEKLSPAKREKYLGRVEEGGVIEGRKIKPTKLDVEAATELSKVPRYDPNSTKLAKYQAVRSEIKKSGEAFKKSLSQEKIAIPKKETAKVAIDAINKVPEKSLLLQSSDPVMKNYTRVLKNALVKEPGNLLGVQKLIETLDDAYENARGKSAFNSDKISALDDIHKATRDALTEYLIKKAKSTDVKIMKKRLWDLYRASDQLRIDAASESGSSLGRMMQNSPKTTKILKSAANATGIGGAVNLMTGN